MKKSFIFILVMLVLFTGSLWSQPPNNFMGGAEFKDDDPRLPTDGDVVKPEITKDSPKDETPVLPIEEDGINLADSKPIITPSGEDQSDYIPILPTEDGATAGKNYPLDNSFDNLVSVPIRETDLSLLEELNELKKKVADLESLIAGKSSGTPTKTEPSENPVDLKLLEDLRKKVDMLEKQRKEDLTKNPGTKQPQLPGIENNSSKEELVKTDPIINDPEIPEVTKVDTDPGDYIEDSTPHRVYYLEKGDFRPAGEKDDSSFIPETTPQEIVKNDPVIDRPVEDIKPDTIETVKNPKESASTIVDDVKKDITPEWTEWDETVLRDGVNVYASLSPGYYIQVGAYSLKTSTAQATVNKLNSKSIAAPVKILKGSDYRRVLVGNLRKDEVGRILAKLESIGYRKTLLIWVK